MYAKFCVSRETATNFMHLFVNRRAYAIQADRPLPNGSVPYYPARDWSTKQPKPLDDGAVRMHLNGDITISLYAINPETQRSKWVAIDADFDGSLEALLQLQWELKQDGVEAALEQSRRGGHLWVLGAAPLLASECRIYVYNLALRLGVPVKGGGLKEGIEVFPRQDRLEDGEFGNAIRAPLGVHRRTNRRYWFKASPTTTFRSDRFVVATTEASFGMPFLLERRSWQPKKSRPPQRPTRASRSWQSPSIFLRSSGV